jgi:hypothetical protein
MGKGYWFSFGGVFDTQFGMKVNGICLALLLWVFSQAAPAQQLTIRKGMIMDSIITGDTIPETFSLYLPSSYNDSIKWPVLLVFDLEDRAKQTVAMFVKAAEAEGYILAASNHVNDSLSISDNILVTSRLLRSITSLFPIDNKRNYTAGKASGAQMATLVPSFIEEVSGVISIGSDIPNTEILNDKRPFYFLGIVGKGDFNYTGMQNSRDLLNRKRHPNTIIVFDGGEEWPDPSYLELALNLLTLRAMKTGRVQRNAILVRKGYGQMLSHVEGLLDKKRLFSAYGQLEEMEQVFNDMLPGDTLEQQLKALKRDPLYRSQKRNETGVLLKEDLVREDYRYYLEEDIITYNFNNLGWWNYQMEELEKFRKSGKLAEQYMGQRLSGYLNAMIEDQITLLMQHSVIDEEALLFLYMLKTITAPEEYSYYLSIISLSSRYEDYGTALFYLEELLKNGYENQAELYSLEHTALLRITPEYNAVIGKYLNDARYDVVPQ